VTEKTLLAKLFPGVQPDFYPSTEVLPDEWQYYAPEERRCVFCERAHFQVPAMIFSNTGTIKAICADCVAECSAILRGREAYDAWNAERGRKFNQEIGPNPYDGHPERRP
jgi:hypothetical protein